MLAFRSSSSPPPSPAPPSPPAPSSSAAQAPRCPAAFLPMSAVRSTRMPLRLRGVSQGVCQVLEAGRPRLRRSARQDGLPEACRKMSPVSSAPPRAVGRDRPLPEERRGRVYRCEDEEVQGHLPDRQRVPDLRRRLRRARGAAVPVDDGARVHPTSVRSYAHPGDGTLRFDAAPPSLDGVAVGRVIVAGVCHSPPAGLLRVVLAVERERRPAVLRTGQAPIQLAYSQAARPRLRLDPDHRGRRGTAAVRRNASPVAGVPRSTSARTRSSTTPFRRRRR